MSRKTMKIDQNFDKKLSEHVCKNRRRTLCLSLRGTQVVLSGEENCVDLALDNKDEMTVGELMEAIKVMGSEEEDEDMRFKTSEQVVFPPFRVKFKGRLWTTLKAREELGIILSILGFGKGGSRKFNIAADEPAGWPDEHSFETFEHPSHTSLKVANEIIESLFCSPTTGWILIHIPSPWKNLRPHPERKKEQELSTIRTRLLMIQMITVWRRR